MYLAAPKTSVMADYIAPVLLIAFNRPAQTTRVFEQIKKAKPTQLFVAVDGPRNTQEAKTVEQVKAIFNIDWECELHTLYRTQNLGCKLAVSSAITWFFEHTEQGIILEDDCLPNDDFFVFCSNMLKLYEKDVTVGHVSGFTLVEFDKQIQQNHILISYSHIWGWATWKRVWDNYTTTPLKDYKFRFDLVPGNLNNKLLWYRNLLLTHKNKIDTWDFQNQYLNWVHGLKSVSPADNMVVNIGFGDNSTHTKASDQKFLLESHPLRNHHNILLHSPALTQSIEDTITKKVFTRNPITNMIRFVYAVLTR